MINFFLDKTTNKITQIYIKKRTTLRHLVNN